MKPIFSLRSFFFGSYILTLASSLQAADRFWDGTSTTANADGGNGTWSAAGLNWDTSAIGGADTTFTTVTDSAIFGGSGGTVTLGAARTAAGITFTSGGYDITTTSANILTIGSGGILMTSDAASLVRIGNATANSGHVTLSASQEWLNESSSLLQQRDGTLSLGANTLTLTSTGGGAISAAGATTGSGNIVVSANTTVGMSSNNTYSGTTTINSGGILTVNNLTNFNTAGGLGVKSTNQASDLVIDGGTLRSQVSDGSTDRLFTVGVNGATFESVLTGANSGRIQFTGSSAITYSGVGNRTITIGGTSDDVGGSSIARVINDVGGGNGTVALVKTGSHDWTVSGTNTFTGGTTLSAGTLTMGNSAALGSTSGQLTVDGGTLNMAANSLTVGNLTGSGGVISGNSGARTLTIGQGNGNGGNFQGVIANGAGGSTALTKTGTGTITLSGTNTDTAATTVSGGTLAVNGSLANTSSVTVGSTATLQGSGFIVSSVTIQNGGTLAAGNSIESLGTGALALNAGSTFAYELQTNLYAGTPEVAGDLTFVSGNLDITAGALLTLTDLASSTVLADGSKLTLLSYTGIWNGGLFTYNATTLNDDSTFVLGANTWRFNYDDALEGDNYTADSTGNFVTMTVIPEPSVCLLSAIGLLFLLRRRR